MKTNVQKFGRVRRPAILVHKRELIAQTPIVDPDEAGARALDAQRDGTAASPFGNTARYQKD